MESCVVTWGPRAVPGGLVADSFEQVPHPHRPKAVAYALRGLAGPTPVVAAFCRALGAADGDAWLTVTRGSRVLADRLAVRLASHDLFFESAAPLTVVGELTFDARPAAQETP